MVSRMATPQEGLCLMPRVGQTNNKILKIFASAGGIAAVTIIAAGVILSGPARPRSVGAPTHTPRARPAAP